VTNSAAEMERREAKDLREIHVAKRGRETLMKEDSKLSFGSNIPYREGKYVRKNNPGMKKCQMGGRVNVSG